MQCQILVQVFFGAPCRDQRFGLSSIWTKEINDCINLAVPASLFPGKIVCKALSTPAIYSIRPFWPKNIERSCTLECRRHRWAPKNCFYGKSDQWPETRRRPCRPTGVYFTTWQLWMKTICCLTSEASYYIICFPRNFLKEVSAEW